MNILTKIDAIRWLPEVSNQITELLAFKFAFEQKEFHLPPNAPQLHQVHGTKVIDLIDILHASEQPLQKADGLFTTDPAKKIFVKTADCLPIVLIDNQQTHAMVIHAGWRGLTAGIIQNGLNIFKKNGIEMKTIFALMGPCISEKNFEIGPEVAHAFIEASFSKNTFDNYLTISKGKCGKWHASLQLAASLVFLDNEIPPEQIYADQRCTFADNNLNSFRREKDKRGNNYTWAEL